MSEPAAEYATQKSPKRATPNTHVPKLAQAVVEYAALRVGAE